MDYEKAWKNLRSVLDVLEKASPLGPAGTAGNFKKMMDKIESDLQNGDSKTKEVK